MSSQNLSWNMCGVGDDIVLVGETIEEGQHQIRGVVGNSRR